MNYLDADAIELARAVNQRNASPEDLLRDAISRLEAVNPHLNAVVPSEFDRARARAQDLIGEGPLWGVPSLIKANGVQWAGAPDTHASRTFSQVVATGSDAIVQAMEAAGLNLFGLTNSPEFALGPSTEPELFGPTLNPWDPTLSPGGSSGGAAVAVASAIVGLAHARDGGGSIRVPASACGLVGFKPSRGWAIGIDRSSAGRQPPRVRLTPTSTGRRRRSSRPSRPRSAALGCRR